MPPYELARVLDFIHGRKTKTIKAPAAASASEGAKRNGQTAPASRSVEEFGLFRNPPRSLRTEVVRYLREREADADWFDSTRLVARKALKRLYALLHVEPGERAQQILFDEDPPADSRLFALRQLAKADSPAEQARAIVEHQIPYRVAATVVRQMTPAVLAGPDRADEPAGADQQPRRAGKRRRARQRRTSRRWSRRKLDEAQTDRACRAYKAEVAADAAGAVAATSGSWSRSPTRRSRPGAGSSGRRRC